MTSMNISWLYRFTTTILCLFLPFMGILLSCSNSEGTTTGSTSYKVIAYIAGWRDIDLEEIQAEQLTHINYAFANIEYGKVVLGHTGDSLNFYKLNLLKQQYPHLKVLISVGGWGWSDHFSDVALTENSRQKFAQSAVDFMIRHQLDGLDIDWEYPGQPGEGNVHRPEDKENFTLLLKALRENLDRQSEREGRVAGDKYLLTIASATNKKYLLHTELGKAQQYLDFINIMTYDFFGGWNKETGHHANLFPSSGNLQSGPNVRSSVRGHVMAGVPSKKIVLGVPFYGRGWAGVKEEHNGLFQPFEGQAFTIPFDSLNSSFVNQNGYQRYWDDKAKAPYLWHPDSLQFISYEDQESLKYKCDFIKEKGLAGVMFWEYSQDKNGALLETLSGQLNP